MSFLLWQVFTGESMEAQIASHEVRLLPKDTPSGAPSCKAIARFDDCIERVVEDEMSRQAGCGPPWMKNNTR